MGGRANPPVCLARVRWVNTTCGLVVAVRLTEARTPQAGSRQRQIRFVTSAPAAGH
jgi:hypothetical protein